MKKACLRLLPVEYMYIQRFGELPETTLEKLGATEGSVLVNERMAVLCREYSQNKSKSDYELLAEQNPFTT